MAQTGPKPKPVVLKLLQGTRPDRVPKDVPVADGPLTRPGWLMPEAKREWGRLVPQLERWGLGSVDRMALAALCQEWARYVECQRLIESVGLTFTTQKGYLMQRPEVSMANRHFQNVRQMCAEFGLTLSSRGRIVTPGEKDNLGEDLLT